MPRQVKFTSEQIERVRDTLAKAPEKPKMPPSLSIRETIISIRSEIQDLLKRGYTYDEISEIIRNGFNLEHLGAATIKQYLNKKRTTSKTSKTTTSK